MEIRELMATLIDEVKFDARSRTAIIRFVEGGSGALHALEAGGLRLFRFYDQYATKGDVVEATQVFVAREGGWLRVSIEIWGPDAGLEIEAELITLDGRTL